MKLKSNVAISDSGYIFNPTSGESFTVNPIGIEMLNLVKAEKPFEEIEQIILNKYNTDADTLEKDYQDFIGLLKQYQLIETGNEE